MQSLIRISELDPRVLSPDSYVVFGGSFDPIHRGHINAIRQLLEAFPRTILAITEQNPWKDETAAPTNIRRNIAKSVIEAENIPLSDDESSPGVSISNVSYEYAEELVTHYRNTLQGTLYWAVGEDIARSVKEWRNWGTLKVTAIVVNIEINLHSADIREGDASLHPAAVELAKQHKLYGYIS
jgi:nicotinate-nucleotide adenylyltransferase